MSGCVARGSRCKVKEGVNINVAVDVKVPVKVEVKVEVEVEPSEIASLLLHRPVFRRHP